jgi:hypothetical protein
MCLVNSAEYSSLEQNDHFCTLTIMIFRKLSLQIQTIFIEKQLLDAADSNMMVFFGKVQVFLQLSWKGLFWANRLYLHLETPSLQEVFFSKTHSIHSGSNGLHTPPSYIDGFFMEIHVFFHLSWIGYLEQTDAHLHLEKPALQEIFLTKPKSILTAKQCDRCCSFYHGWLSLLR